MRPMDKPGIWIPTLTLSWGRTSYRSASCHTSPFIHASSHTTAFIAANNPHALHHYGMVAGELGRVIAIAFVLGGLDEWWTA